MFSPFSPNMSACGAAAAIKDEVNDEPTQKSVEVPCQDERKVPTEEEWVCSLGVADDEREVKKRFQADVKLQKVDIHTYTQEGGGKDCLEVKIMYTDAESANTFDPFADCAQKAKPNPKIYAVAYHDSGNEHKEHVHFLVPHGLGFDDLRPIVSPGQQNYMVELTDPKSKKRVEVHQVMGLI